MIRIGKGICEPGRLIVWRGRERQMATCQVISPGYRTATRWVIKEVTE